MYTYEQNVAVRGELTEENNVMCTTGRGRDSAGSWKIDQELVGKSGHTAGACRWVEREVWEVYRQRQEYR